VDAKLVELVRASEAGKRCPPVRVFTASGLYVGTPGPSAVFAEFMREPLIREYAETLKKGREENERPTQATPSPWHRKPSRPWLQGATLSPRL